MVPGLQMGMSAYAAEKTCDCCKANPRELWRGHRKHGPVTHDRRSSSRSRSEELQFNTPECSPGPQAACQSLGGSPEEGRRAGVPDTRHAEEPTGCSYISVSCYFSPSQDFLQVKPILPVCHNAMLISFSFKKTSLKPWASL